ncbi:MAG: hypothetical protein QOK25_1332 [Thermoleophilaceae bacterium]|nr:hypothetical protein [Thermoleophilaceae bacterium]
MKPRGNLPQLTSAVGGVLLFLFLFLAWFGSGGGSLSAWETFSFVDIVLAAIALFVAGYSIATLLGSAPRFPWLRPRLITLAGVLATTLTVAFMIELTSGSTGADLQIGAFLSVLACLAIVAGGVLSERPDLAARVEAAAEGLTSGAGSGPGAPPGASPLAAPPGTSTSTPTAGGTEAPTAVQPSPGATPPAPSPSPAAEPSQVPPVRPAVPQPAPPAEQAGPPAGWYPDPQGQARLRYWDGGAWTDQTSA